uniref:Uncharacterized protein n=1 Tax=Acrobeloides nanus TaxID=290746 RepID=A0A914DXI3_9BILA
MFTVAEEAAAPVVIVVEDMVAETKVGGEVPTVTLGELSWKKIFPKEVEVNGKAGEMVVHMVVHHLVLLVLVVVSWVW